MNKEQAENPGEVRCELVDFTHEVLEDCNKPVKWLINLPNMVWTACDEHFQFFKSEAERCGFEKVVKYDLFEIDLYHEKLKELPSENYLNPEE